MITLSEKAVQDFQSAFYRNFGKKIDGRTAQKLELQLLEFVVMIYRLTSRKPHILGGIKRILEAFDDMKDK